MSIKKMSETAEFIIAFCILIGVIALTRKFHAWKTQRAYHFIVQDLKTKGAYDPESAIELPYAKRNILRMGIRDHRPTAIDHLVLENIVGISEDGKYYLKNKTL